MSTMRFPRFVAALQLLPLVMGLPTTLTVQHNSMECYYDEVAENERITASVFILSGAELKGTLLLEGPVALPNATIGKNLQSMVDMFDRGEVAWGPYGKIEQVVNFEHLEAGIDIVEDDFPGDEDDDDTLWREMDDDKLSEAERERHMTERKRKIALARDRAIEASRKRKAALNARSKSAVRKDGDPEERTLTAKAAGWYRACVKGSWYQITAELEMRKESELGGVDPATGHVMSYSKKEEEEENKFLDEEKPEEEEEGLKDEDFNVVRGQLKKLRSVLSLIQQRQTGERHRLVVHAATNEHSHSRMVLSNLFQTVLFMMVTGVQVYTIRKWFSGENSLLKR